VEGAAGGPDGKHVCRAQSDVSPEVARKAYGETAYRRLVPVKERYDPANLFRLNQNIQPREMA